MAASLCGVLFPYSTPFPNTFRAKVAVTWDFGRENYKGFLDSKFPTYLCMVDQVHFGGGGAVLFFYFQKVGGVHLRQIDSTSIVPGVAGTNNDPVDYSMGNWEVPINTWDRGVGARKFSYTYRITHPAQHRSNYRIQEAQRSRPASRKQNPPR